MSALLPRLKSVFSSPAWICFVWFGMTAGVSLLATPVKFAAPLLTRPAALDVGAVTFAALNKAEFVALILLLIVVRVSGRAAQWWAVCGVLTLILIAQSAWLLPELTARAGMVASGVELPRSIAHSAYAVLEIAKLVLLFAGGVAASMPAERGNSSTP